MYILENVIIKLFIMKLILPGDRKIKKKENGTLS